MFKEAYYDNQSPRLKFVDLDGKRIKKNPFDYPYNYDEYVLWKGDYNKEKSKVVYSDRLKEWDSDKFNKCCKKIFGDTGQYFSNRKPEYIEKFLRLYFEKEIKLTAILEGCNQSSGYPVWIFIYEENL